METKPQTPDEIIADYERELAERIRKVRRAKDELYKARADLSETAHQIHLLDLGFNPKCKTVVKVPESLLIHAHAILKATELFDSL